MAGGANRTPLLEWIAGIVGLLTVAGSVGFMIRQGLQDKAPYPQLAFEIVEVRPQADAFLVEVLVRNRGAATAQDARISGRLETPAGPQVSEAVIDFIPADSSRRAGLYFTADPRRHSLTVRAEGYQRP